MVSLPCARLVKPANERNPRPTCPSNLPCWPVACFGNPSVAPRGRVLVGLRPFWHNLCVPHDLCLSPVDPKFREAPDLQLKIEVAGVGLGSGVAILGIMAGFTLARRVAGRSSRERHWTQSLLAGVLTQPLAGLGFLLFRTWLPSFADNISDMALLALPALYCIFWIKGPTNPWSATDRTYLRKTQGNEAAPDDETETPDA